MGRDSSVRWERNRVGPYTVAERYGQVPLAEGRVYEAFHATTGAPALLVAPPRAGGWHAEGDWAVRATVAQHEGCLALELERVPEGAQLPELTLALYRLARGLAQVEDRPEAQSALLEAKAHARRQRARWRARPGAWGALAAGCVVALVLAPRTHTPRAQWQEAGLARTRGAPDAGAPAQLGPEALAVPVATLAERQHWEPVSLDLPKRPFEGQRRAPCEEGETEIELKDGSETCWIGVTYSSSTCKRRGYEYEGKCYLPSVPPPRKPTSDRP